MLSVGARVPRTNVILLSKNQKSLQRYMYIGHPYLITALFEIRPVAYFGPKQDTFDQKTILFLLQCGVTF